MHRISVIAIIAAFGAELLADQVIGAILIVVFAQGSIEPNMTEEAARQALEMVQKSPALMAFGVLFGSGTTVGGGYLAARIARKFPYYNGLAMGVVGLTLQLYLWQMNPLWLNILSVLTVIPLSILGAHIARPHIPPPE